MGKILGITGLLLILFLPDPQTLPPAAQRLAAVTFLMACLWISQAVSIAATSLIPLALFPLLGILSAKEVSRAYIDENVILFLGGFVIALGIEKWGLHRRIALHIVRIIGAGPKQIILGLMIATGFLSMWISNTASSLLMMPIGLALIRSLHHEDDEDQQGQRRFALVLMLCIAYSASIGGFTTLVGTPTNIQFQKIWSEQFPSTTTTQVPEISAGEWMVAVLPLGIVFLLMAWGLLTFKLKPFTHSEKLTRGEFTKRLRQLGKPSRAEWLMLILFLSTAALWIFRKPLTVAGSELVPGWGGFLATHLANWGVKESSLHDSTVAMVMAILMFFIPASKSTDGRREYLMDWKTAEKLPWEILLLFGGGFALAKGFTATGLSLWMGKGFAELAQNWPLWLTVAACCFMLTFLTELTSNVATISAILPVLAGTAIEMQIDPRLLMIPATLSASCAFMLPIATPPNAIVFGSGQIRMQDMARYGLLLNLLGVIVITLATFALLVPQLGISLDGLPSWASLKNIN